MDKKAWFLVALKICIISVRDHNHLQSNHFFSKNANRINDGKWKVVGYIYRDFFLRYQKHFLHSVYYD